MFTTCVITASAILFREFSNVPLQDWVGLICGFLTVLIAIILLHCCKNYDITLAQLAKEIVEKVEEDSGNEEYLEDEQVYKIEANVKLLNPLSAKQEHSYGTLGEA